MILAEILLGYYLGILITTWIVRLNSQPGGPDCNCYFKCDPMLGFHCSFYRSVVMCWPVSMPMFLIYWLSTNIAPVALVCWNIIAAPITALISGEVTLEVTLPQDPLEAEFLEMEERMQEQKSYAPSVNFLEQLRKEVK